MKRDPNTIRAILIAVEQQAPVLSAKLAVSASPESVQYHCALLGSADYVDFRNESTLRQWLWRIMGLTMKGHALVEAIKDDDVWLGIRAELKMDERTVPFEVIEEFAMRRARLAAGLPEPKIVVLEQPPAEPAAAVEPEGTLTMK